MKLTAHSNYALRTLQLAALRAPGLIRVDDVVQVHRLARPHIVKIVHELGRAGFLRTQRGRRGGFGLARPAGEIVVGDVIRLTEGPLHVVECFDINTNTCVLIGVCRLSAALREATQAFMQILDGLTVADLAANETELRSRMSIPVDGDAALIRRTR